MGNRTLPRTEIAQEIIAIAKKHTLADAGTEKGRRYYEKLAKKSGRTFDEEVNAASMRAAAAVCGSVASLPYNGGSNEKQ